MKMEHRYHCFAKVGVRNFEASGKRRRMFLRKRRRNRKTGRWMNLWQDPIARDLESQREWPVEEDDELDLEGTTELFLNASPTSSLLLTNLRT